MKIKKPIPFSFVLEKLENLSPTTRPMFGCTSVYVDEKIVLIFREKEDHTDDNGIWLATTSEHHASLKKEFRSLRSIRLFGPGETGWQNLPADSSDFETDALRICDLIKNKDVRIGKVPKKKSKKRTPPKPTGTRTSTRPAIKKRK